MAALNYWEHNYGTAYAPDAQLKSTGEANARIANLKQKLNEKGAIYHWSGTEYVLDAVRRTRPRERNPGMSSSPPLLQGFVLIKIPKTLAGRRHGKRCHVCATHGATFRE